MRENDKPVLVYATYPTLAAAEQAGCRLVDERLAACVNILPRMISIYQWQGTRHRDEEAVMIAKTRSSLSDHVMQALRTAHPYDNPATLVLPVSTGAEAYLAWIASETSSPGDERP